MSNDKWIKKWEVESKSSGNIYVVAQDKDGNYGCSCPVWKFKRQECKHIRQIKESNPEESVVITTEKPDYVLAKVLKPTYKKETNQLLIPLIELPDVRFMEATICYNLLMHGYTMKEIREIRHHIPNEWTKEKIINHIQIHGEAEYPEDYYKTPFCRC